MPPDDPGLLLSGAVRETEGGGCIVEGGGGRACVGVSAKLRPVLGLADGTRPLSKLLSAAAALPEGPGTLETLSLLRNLAKRGLLSGMPGVAASRSPTRRSLSLPLPGSGALLEAGALVPAAAWRGAAWAGLGFCAAAVALSAAAGDARALLDPFSGLGPSALAVPAAYCVVSLLLSLRSLALGCAIRSLGLPSPGLGLTVRAGMLYARADERARRAAPAPERLTLALWGIGALAWAAGVLVAAALATGVPALRAAAALALLCLLADTAPNLRGDGRDLAGILTRIPGLRRRALRYLAGRAVRNAFARARMGSTERAYLVVGSVWAAHAAASLILLAYCLLPAALDLLYRQARSMEGGFVAVAVGVIPLLILFACSIIFAILLVGALIGFALQLVPESRGRRLAGPGAGCSNADDLVAACGLLPGLDSLAETTVRRLAGSAVREVHEPGSFILRQGAPAGAVGVLVRGSVQVEREEISGARARLAEVAAPALLGESALLKSAPAAASVVATGRAEVWLLDADELLRAAADQGAAASDRLSSLGLVRLSPLLCCVSSGAVRRLLDGCAVERHEAGQDILRSGDPGDSLFVVSQGRCSVLRGGGAESVIGVIGPGEWFGELALLVGGTRMATVRADTDTVVVRIHRGLLDGVLLDDPLAGLRLLDVASERLAALTSVGGV